MSMTAIQQNN